MNILIASDKFKGSLSAKQVNDIVSSGIQSRFPKAEVTTLPMADGGEGTAEVLTIHSGARKVLVSVKDPLMRQIESWFGISTDRQTAFIEMSSASGLHLLNDYERDCTITTSFGTGELIRHAMDHGAKKIIIGIGGSATNDAGIGMALALGIKSIDQTGKSLEGRGRDLVDIRGFDFSTVHPRIAATEFIVLTDVNSPLFGPHGAAHVFAKQKGATPDQINMLDEGLRNFAVTAAQSGFNFDFPGAGAAGGLGAGSAFFLHATITNGMSFIADTANLEEKIRNADLVISGEGKLDKQTLSGKVVKGIADYCRMHTKKLIVFTGICELTQTELNELGIAQVISLSNSRISPSTAMAQAQDLLLEKVKEIQL